MAESHTCLWDSAQAPESRTRPRLARKLAALGGLVDLNAQLTGVVRTTA